MRARPLLAALPLLLTLVLAGCAGRETDPVTTSTTSEAAPVDPWNGTTRQLILQRDETGTTQLDALCLLGGGIHVERDGPGLVLPGTSHLEANITVGPQTTGFQLGYALTRDPGYDETQQDNVTWLPIVRGGSESFQVPVPPGAYETDSDDLLWAFYVRMNASEQTDCYTGAQVQGELKFEVQAVRSA